MTEQEQERFEIELRKIAPARLPEDLIIRLRAAITGLQPGGRLMPRSRSRLAHWFAGVRWALAATSVAVAAILVVVMQLRPNALPRKISPVVLPEIKASSVQIDHTLVSSFYAIAQLPGGEHVRF